MKKITVLLLAVLLLLSLVGCGATNVEMLPTEEPLTEEVTSEIETLPEEEPVAEADKVDESNLQQTVDEDPWVGIWSSANGQQTDGTAEYHNYYICLFDDGTDQTAFRYGWRLMDAGTWSIENGVVTAVFDQSYATWPGEGWGKTPAMDTVSFEVKDDTLVITEANEESDFSYKGTYYPANRKDAYEKCLNMLATYQTCSMEAASDQSEMDAYNELAVGMYCGLEQLLYGNIMHSLSAREDMDAFFADELTWLSDRLSAVNEVLDAHDDAKTMSFVRSNKEIELTKARIEELLLRLDDTAEMNVFAMLPEMLTFMSGMGGWGTDLYIAPDGTFTGRYADYDLGVTGEDHPNGSCRICEFSGKFTQPERLDDYTWSMKLESLETEGQVGDTYVEDGTLYTCAEPYGLDNADTFYIYLPGKPVSTLPQEFVYWATWLDPLQDDETIPEGIYGLYNEGGQQGFVGEKTETTK